MSGPGSPSLDYRPLSPRRPVAVDRLYSVHYFEWPISYAYSGESHDFWELLYVDKGAVEVTAGDRRLRLDQGQIIFHPPGEFHAFSAAGAAPDLVVVGFGCPSPALDFFRGRTASLRGEERALLGRIVSESAAAFSTPLNLSQLTEITRREGAPQPRADGRPEDGGALAQVMDYLERRVDQPLTLEQICRDNLVGRSQLQKLFHARTGGGVMAWFGALKIQAARRLIREGRLNFTQIAARLGFQSVHYFSRRFRQVTGMSPSEYERSVKMLSEGGPAPDESANNVHDSIFPFRPGPPTIGTDSNGTNPQSSSKPKGAH